MVQLRRPVAGSLLVAVAWTCIGGGVAPLHGREVQFADRTWNVKRSTGLVGPGPNRFSDAPEDVWVDAAGLHLTIHKYGANWYSTEVILNESLGYGTYMFQTTSRQDILNANATFGAFTWDPFGGDVIPNNPNREIDFEDGRWSNPSSRTNSQVVVQPYTVNGNLQRLTIPGLSADAKLTRFFTWSPDKIEFFSLRGHHSPTDFPAEAVFHHFTYLANGTNHLIPTPGRENFRFNLWLFRGSPPVGEQPVEAVISDFAFLPLKSGDFDNNGAVDGDDLSRWQSGFADTRLADADADGDSDGADFLAWQRGLGAAGWAAAAVPEPAGSAALTLCLVWIAIRCR